MVFLECSECSHVWGEYQCTNSGQLAIVIIQMSNCSRWWLSTGDVILCWSLVLQVAGCFVPKLAKQVSSGSKWGLWSAGPMQIKVTRHTTNSGDTWWLHLARVQSCQPLGFPTEFVPLESQHQPTNAVTLAGHWSLTSVLGLWSGRRTNACLSSLALV